jgi:hypothetical protein
VSEILGVCDNLFGPYHCGVHAYRKTCRGFVSSDSVNAAQEIRAKVDRERGVHPSVAFVVDSVKTRGICNKDLEPHPYYTLCENWRVPVYGFCENGPCAHEIGPGCKNWIDFQGARVGQTIFEVRGENNRRQEKGGYYTLMTPREMDYLNIFPPETDEEREARRQREWKQMYAAIRTEKENYELKTKERYKEQQIRKDERMRIADEIEGELAKPRADRRSRRGTARWLRCL